MGNNTIWIIVAVVAVVALGAWYFMSAPGGTPGATDEPAAIEAPATDAPVPEAPATGN